MAARAKRWLGLGPDEIHGYYACTVNIAPLLPSNRIAEGQFGLEQANAGAIAMKTHRQEFLHLPYPEEEEDEVMAERFKQSEQWQTLMMKRIAERMGLLDEMEEMQREQQMAALPPQPGFAEDMALDQQEQMAAQPAAAPGMPGAAGLAPMPGQGMPLLPPTPPAPGMAPSGMPGGRAAGVGGQPSTQMMPGGMPENS